MKKSLQSSLICLLFILTNIAIISAQDLPPFEKILVTGNVSILLVEGTTESMDIKNDASLLEYEVEGQTLKLSSKNLIKYNKQPTIKVAIVYQRIREIKARAGASVYSDNRIEEEALHLRFSSGASGELTITAKTIEVSVSEGGTLELQGITAFLEAKAVTGGTLSAYDLDSQSTIVKTNTGGNAKVIAYESLDATAKTGGSIAYKGDPKKVRTKDGLSGSIKEF